MSAPPKQTKISYKKGKTSVTYESNLDAASYYIHELTRAALKDVGKYVVTKFREAYYQNFKKHGKGYGGKAASYSVIASKTTTAPRVQIGLRAKTRAGFYAFFQEFGTHDGKVPRLGLLTKAVKNNVAEIIKIESQYLSGLSGEARRLDGLINERTEEGNADGKN